MLTTWDTMRTSRACARNAEATAPRATRVAVSRALERSRTGRASSKPYFCIPTRSACPGRGRVSGALRACPSSSAGSTGSAAITRSHFGHSVLAMRRATGPPRVQPCRTPPRNSTSSRSKLIRAPRPKPRRRRASASARSVVVVRTPAGTPSMTPTSAGPCDSPAVSQRSMPRSSQTAGAAHAPHAATGRPDAGGPSRAVGAGAGMCGSGG
jgi:hypothetical protein